MAKIAHEKWDTYQNVFDNFTLRNLFKLESQGHFVELESTVSMGKEANTFSARREDGSYILVKIYRLETCDFNRLYDYIKFDPRYQGLRRQKRKIIFAWCQREYRNLLKLREAGIRVPKPIAFMDNILLMEQINDGSEVAPKLKDSYIDDPEDMYEKVSEYMRLMQKKAGLVHGDLSAYNILNMNQEPVIIDVSQSMPVEAQTFKELLIRDVRNVVNFFKKQGLKIEEDDLYKKITD